MRGVTADLVGCQCETFVMQPGTHRCGTCNLVLRRTSDGKVVTAEALGHDDRRSAGTCDGFVLPTVDPLNRNDRCARCGAPELAHLPQRVVTVTEVKSPATIVTKVGEEIAHDPRLMDLSDAGSGERLAVILYAAANGAEQAFPAGVDALQFAGALRALADKHRDKAKVAVIMSVVS